MNPILGLQHESWYGDRDPGGIRQKLKAEQGQGHSHLQLVHGKLFANAVPGSERDSKISGFSFCLELCRHCPWCPSIELGIQGTPSWDSA